MIAARRLFYVNLTWAIPQFRKQKHANGASWRMDETYTKVKGKWCDDYRAMDKDGKTLDFLLCKKRDKKAGVGHDGIMAARYECPTE